MGVRQKEREGGASRKGEQARRCPRRRWLRAKEVDRQGTWAALFIAPVIAF